MVTVRLVRNKVLLSLGLILLLASGCGRQSGDASTTIAAAAPQAPKVAGPPSFTDFPVPPKPEVTPALVARGKALYGQNCAACHGENGDAQADAAAFLLPKPRNFVAAKYRLRSTVSGQLPTDVDLFRSISLGMPGTPMPPWRFALTDEDRWALVEYIKTFSPRFAETAPRTMVDLGAPPAKNEAHLLEGKNLYAQMSCNACHGETGRGDGPSGSMLTDDSGSKIKPRDFTRPAGFKSGYSPKDMVRSMLTGFDGTPMVGFEGALKAEDAWKIAYYLESLARPQAQTVARPSQSFLAREDLGPPDVKLRITERAWKFDPQEIRVKKGEIVEVTFEPTDNGLGAGHGFAISSYDEVAFINGAMVGVPKTAKFRADRAGKFTIYCPTQCSTDKLHPLMNATFIVEDGQPLASNH